MTAEASIGPEDGPVLIATPTGRDAEVVQLLLGPDGINCKVINNLGALSWAIGDDTGAVLIADEALGGYGLSLLTERLRIQPPWSDLPFIVLTGRNSVASRHALADLHLPETLGNVMFLERPLNAVSLISAVHTALRARRRQRQVRDYIIEHAAIAEERRQLNKTLEARIAERSRALRLSEAALAQSQKMEAVGRLTGGIAHDFNNLLTAIVGNLELLQPRLSDDERALRLTDAALQAALRGAKLTGQLLAFSRTQKLDLRATDINDVLRRSDELLAQTIGPLIELRLRPDPAIPPAIADSNQLELALLNLAINARDAMPEGGRLTIATGQQVIATDKGGGDDEGEHLKSGRYVVISVADTGTGMPPEVRARALEPFFTTKGIGKGTGLGLAQVYGIARQSGGGIQIESAVGRGTTVRILLREARATRRRGSNTIDQDELRETDAGPPGSVLVVDDDTPVRRVLVAGLEAQGYQVHEAANGPAALEMLERGLIVDIAIVDFAMPGMNGAALAEAARRLRPGLPIVFASGYAETAALDAVPGAKFYANPFE